MYFILKRSGKIIGPIVILTICVLLNWFCFVTDMSDEVYRMVCFRYLFLSVIAYIWLHKENYSKELLTILGIASYLYLVGIENKSIYPIIFDGGWGIHNYPAYFFTLLLIFGFIELHSNLSKESRIMKSIYWCGQNSWYLFLSQMTVLYFFGIGRLDFITNSYIKVLAYVLLIVTVCVINTIVANRVLAITRKTLSVLHI